MLDLDKIGGVPVILNNLLEKGLIHGNITTIQLFRVYNEANAADM
jgi:dihydroxyacid dehydratase/phosphogluconate dehydratase